ncbi:MAG: NAD-dependent epimerase/dehydratase family protein [Verrucomicrobiae bacterium]|nr:NAD-dependent epimerase/dehydratase family protein [Verrucomicrobiae bacterium]
MSKAIITGACGFIGSCLARRLLERGDEVVGIDNLSRRGSEFNAARLRSAGMRLIRADLSSQDKAEGALNPRTPSRASKPVGARNGLKKEPRRAGRHPRRHLKAMKRALAASPMRPRLRPRASVTLMRVPG